MQVRWLVAVLCLAAGCGGGGGVPVEALCAQVAEVRELPYGARFVEALAALGERAPGEMAADMDTVVRFSEVLLGGALPSAAATEEAQAASARVRARLVALCERGGTRQTPQI